LAIANEVMQMEIKKLLTERQMTYKKLRNQQKEERLKGEEILNSSPLPLHSQTVTQVPFNIPKR